MRGTLFTLMCCACALASAASATVYKWVDENGITHYSDQPHQNAAQVDVQKPAKVGSVAPALAQGIPSSSGAGSEPPAYTGCSITSPTPDEVFLNTFTVSATLSVQPGLRGGDRVVISLDGKPVAGLPESGTQFTLSQVDRGSHSLQATILDGNGKTVCQTASVTFHVRQPSVLNPNRPRG
jgi:Domain of unknown function (DUF4124)